MTQTILLIIGFACLLKGAGLLVNGASAIAHRLKVSDLAIGLTVVAFGTSLPELSVNIAASLKGTSEIAIGNIIGSNITNILLILGISSVIFPLTVTRGTVWKEIPLVLLVTLITWVMANDRLIDGNSSSFLSRIDGVVLLGFFSIFIYYTCSIAEDIRNIEDPLPIPTTIIKPVLYVTFGLISLIFGGRLIISSAVFLAQKMGMSETFIGLTLVAVGTSLPELATSVVAAWKKNPDIAIGNVVGSNIFNFTFVFGISSLIRPLPFQPQNNVDIGVASLSCLLLFFFMFTGGKKVLDRWKGVFFLAFYTVYIVYLFLRG